MQFAWLLILLGARARAPALEMFSNECDDDDGDDDDDDDDDDISESLVCC